MTPESRRAEVWVSDGLPASALQKFLATASPESWRRLPLIGGMTVWDEPRRGKVLAAVACPNRLGVYEPVPPRQSSPQLWWWSDPLDAHGSAYGSHPRVERVSAPAPLPGDHSLSEAGHRSQRAAGYLARRIRQLRGVQIPTVPHGRRFPVLLPVAPAPLLEGATEEIVIPRSVDGWPGLVVCEVGWWQSTARLDAIVESVARATRGERPPPLPSPKRVWTPFG